jgi:uncharacterized protein YbbC (DUF1343 family)/CubicO group peptidase (beta-lactamase class C family)
MQINDVVPRSPRSASRGHLRLTRCPGNARGVQPAGFWLIVIALCWASVAHAAPLKLPRAEPSTVGMDESRLAVIDDLVAEGLRNKNMPGAVVLVARHGNIVYFKAFGHRQLQPAELPMTTDTVFDLASITKPMATATSVMKLIEERRIDLYAPVSHYFPDFAQNGKEAITIQHLLTHQSGLLADNALADYADGPAKSFERIHALKLTAPPTTRFIYSDVNYITLGELVEKVTELNVHEFSQQHVFQPLGMAETGYLPREELRQRAATTEEREGRWMQGEVHDPRAYKLGGVAGHAGLFSTAEDMAVYAQMMLGDGMYQAVRVFEPATVALMTRSNPVPGGSARGLGWDMRTGYSTNRGDRLSPRAFGHGGFTGTVLWIDPELDLFYIFLSNRVHPNGKGLVNPLAGRIGSAIAAAVTDLPTSRSARRSLPEKPVLTGIDVLERDAFAVLKGRRIGLITNHTGVSRSGKTTVELLHGAKDVELKALFSPEHGIAGALDVSKIGDARDEKTGLPIFSLYGESRTPSAESLSGLDTLVFDIQDIGARFYTYPSTMGNAMKAAAKHGLRFVVLDRPNAINGMDVEGPVLDDGGQSFVGYHTVAVRHGLTVGELATMFNAEMNLGCDLQVIRCEGWQRGDYFDRTSLSWINPSPNMRSLTAAVLYPGIGLLETTNLSVGRGTDRPFEVLGAPWFDGPKVASALNAANLPGVRFVPVRFTPESSKFAKEECGGVNIIATDRDIFRPVFAGVKIAETLRKLHPNDWDTKAFNRLLIDQPTFDAIVNGKTAEDCERQWDAELKQFRERRQRFLLY